MKIKKLNESKLSFNLFNPDEKLNRMIKEDTSYEWNPNTNFKHIKDIYNKVKSNNYKFVNNEREEFQAAVKKAEKKGYKPEQCREIKKWSEDVWRHTSKAAMNESINIDTIADYITDHYEFDNIDDKYACINSIKDSFNAMGEKTISQEELDQFIGEHNGRDLVETYLPKREAFDTSLDFPYMFFYNCNNPTYGYDFQKYARTLGARKVYGKYKGTGAGTYFYLVPSEDVYNKLNEVAKDKYTIDMQGLLPYNKEDYPTLKFIKESFQKREAFDVEDVSTEYIFDGTEIPESEKHKLQKIIISDSLNYIPNNAFKNCTSLKSIVIPDSVEWIGYHAFDNCKSLTSITFPNSLDHLGDFMFKGCTSLTSVIIPKSIRKISTGAFYNSSIKNITIPSNIIEIENNAFLDCPSLENVIIEDGVKQIHDTVFAYCPSLKSITIPDSVTSIGYGTFYECTSLTNITLPKKLKSIKERTFDNCTSLNNVIIPSGLKRIAYAAFRNCTSLTNIVIPDSVNRIANHEEQDYDPHLDRYLKSTINDEENNPFYNCNSLTIICPKDSYASKYAKTYDIPVKLVESYSAKKKLSESTVTRYQVEYYTDPDSEKLIDYIYADSKREAEKKVKDKVGNCTIVAMIPEEVPSSYRDNDLKEAYYGGTYDIEDDQYFTRDDLVEFAEDVVERLNTTSYSKFDYTEVYMEPGNILELTLVWSDYEETFKQRIDMRKIRKPQDLIRIYSPIFIMKAKSTFSEYGADFGPHLRDQDYTMTEDLSGKYSDKSLNEDVAEEDKFILYLPHLKPRTVDKETAIKSLEQKLNAFKSNDGSDIAGTGFAIYCLQSIDKDGTYWVANDSSREFIKSLTYLSESVGKDAYINEKFVDKDFDNNLSEDLSGKYSNKFKALVKKLGEDDNILTPILSNMIRYCKEEDLKDLWIEKDYDTIFGDDDKPLDEDFEGEPLKGPKEGPESGLSTLLNSAIQSEFKAIQEYNDLAIMARANGYDEIASVADEIGTDENDHVGKLQDLLKTVSPNAEAIDRGLSESLNLDKEGRMLKRLISQLVMDDDSELRNFISRITQEVIDKGNGKKIKNPMNLDKDGKKIKKLISKIVVDNDDELKDYVMSIVNEVITESKSLQESGLQGNSMQDWAEHYYDIDRLEDFVCDQLQDGTLTEDDLINIAKKSSTIEVDDMKKAINLCK